MVPTAPSGIFRAGVTTSSTTYSREARAPIRRSSACGLVPVVCSVSAFWLWFLLPVAIYYQRKARREVEASNGFYEWPRTLLNRPIALFLVVLAATLALVMVMVVIGIYGDPGGA